MGSWIAKSFKTDLPVRKLAQPTVEVELNWQVSKNDNCYSNLQQKLWLKQTEPTFTDLVQSKKRKKGCVLFN